MPNQVLAARCRECLFGKDRIVRPEAAGDIIRATLPDPVEGVFTHFVCHKATMEKLEVACHGWHEAAVKRDSVYARLVELGAIQFIAEEDLERRQRAGQAAAAAADEGRAA